MISGLLKWNESMCSYRVVRILHAVLFAWFSVFHWVLEVPSMIVTYFFIRESMVSVEKFDWLSSLGRNWDKDILFLGDVEGGFENLMLNVLS